MNLQFLKDSKPFSQLFAVLLISMGIGILVSLTGILISALFVDGNILTRIELMDRMQHEGDLGLMKYLQVLSQLGFFILPAVIFGFFVNKNISQFFLLEKAPKITVLFLGLFTIIAAVPFSDWLIYQNNLMKLPASMADLEQWMRIAEEKAAHMTNLFLQMDSLSDYLINIFMIGILAAVGEELLLRGVLQPLFIKITKNAHAGIWIAAFVFSFIHFQFYGFFARLFMGAILGYLFYYTNNLWIPIIVHFFNNSAAVTYVYITNTPLDSTNLSEIAIQENGGLYAIISLLLVILGLYVLYSMRQKTLLVRK